MSYKNITIMISFLAPSTKESLSTFQILKSKKPIVVLSPRYGWEMEALRGRKNCTRLNVKPVADQEIEPKSGPQV